MPGGLDDAAVEALVGRARQEIDAGHLPSCQMALARGGEVLFSATLGDAAPDSRYVVFSATKPFVASAVWALLGEGALDVGRRVCEYVPEFATNGKDVVTVEQVLLHTAGFPHAPFDPLEWDDAERRRARFASWRCNWEPGTRFEYHATSAHWVLAELIERVTGEDFRAYLRRRVLEPLGLTRFALGVPPGQQHDVRPLVPVGEPASPAELRDALGIDELPVTEVTPEALLSFNRPELRAVGVPGGGGVSDAADVARFYQALLHDRAGVWDPAVLADATGVVRNTFPDYLGVPANRTRGLVVAGDDGRAHLRGFGRTVSPRAFGHSGAGGQIAWADPATGLSFCFLTNGLDQHVLREWRRTTAIASRAGATAA
ncbi:MAG: serine hydrolase [Acidimicrobiia bacterium]|nr:MAG: serine hydrolase [Acidimicrobiia bacterium]